MTTEDIDRIARNARRYRERALPLATYPVNIETLIALCALAREGLAVREDLANNRHSVDV